MTRNRRSLRQVSVPDEITIKVVESTADTPTTWCCQLRHRTLVTR